MNWCVRQKQTNTMGILRKVALIMGMSCAACVVSAFSMVTSGYLMPSRTGGSAAFQLLATELAVTAPPDLWTWAVADASVHRALERWLRYEMWFSIFHGIYAAIVVGVALILLRRARKRVAVAMGSFAGCSLLVLPRDGPAYCRGTFAAEALSSKAGEEDWSANIRWSSFAWRLVAFLRTLFFLFPMYAQIAGLDQRISSSAGLRWCIALLRRFGHATTSLPTIFLVAGILGISSTSLKVLYFLVEPSVALYFLGQWFACLHFLCCAAMDKAEM